MTNPMFNPQPNYSGVTIQISNPAVYAGQCSGKNAPYINGGQCGINNLPNNQYINYPQASYANYSTPTVLPNDSANSIQQKTSEQNATNPIHNTGYPNAYPVEYYLNNYNYNNTGVNSTGVNGNGTNDTGVNDTGVNNEKNKTGANSTEENNNALNNTTYQENSLNKNEGYNGTNSYKAYAQNDTQQTNDMTKSQDIIGDITKREAEIQEEKKNTKETKIVALTDEYIKSLENYLNNPNDEIRLMASKEILTRLDEDKDRYDDAALNALLNKMLQDPNKLVRIAALSAFASQLACGNDYTVQLLHNIQSNPNADKEDVLQAADILLKMSAGVEVKNIPNPSVKETKQQ